MKTLLSFAMISVLILTISCRKTSSPQINSPVTGIGSFKFGDSTYVAHTYSHDNLSSGPIDFDAVTINMDSSTLLSFTAINVSAPPALGNYVMTNRVNLVASWQAYVRVSNRNGSFSNGTSSQYLTVAANGQMGQHYTTPTIWLYADSSNGYAYPGHTDSIPFSMDIYTTN